MPTLCVPAIAQWLARRGQDKTGRPISPHVSIYLAQNTFPAIAISSITVRITGCFLSLGIGGIGGMSLLSGPDAVVATAESIGNSALAPLAKFSTRAC